MDLNIVWFGLIAFLLIGYAILDGFDFGVGILNLFAHNNEERRIHMNAIGPVWDGNEVWLLTGGGALFAAFPIVYATVLSGFYLPFIVLFLALMFRAVSFDLRGKVESDQWRTLWDWAFGLGSLLPALLLGIVYGNMLRGIPLDAEGFFKGNYFIILNPFSLLVGITAVVLFTMHGAIYMTMKTENELQTRMHKWANNTWSVFVVLYVVITLYAWLIAPHLFDGTMRSPIFWMLFVLLLNSMIAIPLSLGSKKYGRAFLASSALIFSLIGVSAVSLFPRLVPSSIDLANSLTIYNSSSSPYTLSVMLVIALIGMPIVIGYTIYIYRVFKGKVRITKESY
jgi:cytochrome d ubiquinol oxidase subunit II